MNLPENVAYIINRLEQSGFEAFAVGGCVRDCCMNREPKDWDICTQALPEQIKGCFERHNIIETGIKHGTLTLMLKQNPYEITTYRVDGQYSDRRHPDRVEFVDSLYADLSRRDFSVNAMAYNPRTGVVDYFGGEADLRSKTIRCVGNAGIRFNEDALRIIRALRFASVLGFSIENATSDALLANKRMLQNVAAERINSEFNMLLTGPDAVRIMSKYSPVVWEIIPELEAEDGFNQKTPYHYLDIWQHTLTAVGILPADLILRLTMLLHDIAKPKCFSEEDGIGHFYGHPKAGTQIAKDILTRMKYDKATISAVTTLILHHDTEILPAEKYIKRWLFKIGEKAFRQLLEIKRADAIAQAEKYRYGKLAYLDEITDLLNGILEQGQCFTIRDLAVNGNDIIAAGIPEGEEVGKVLYQLLQKVINEEISNDKAVLLRTVRSCSRKLGSKKNGRL